MGVDFLKSKCKPFDKAWDVERVGGSSKGKNSPAVAGNIVAKTRGCSGLHEGDEVLVRADGDQLTVLVDLAPAAVLVDPTPAIVTAIRDSGGYANGKIEAAYPTLDLLKIQIR